MKKYLSGILFACVLSTSPGVLNCQCVGADCDLALKAVQADVPQCHRASAAAQGADPSRQGCCGKCRIEKAAVLSSELSSVRDVRRQDALEVIKYFDGFHSKLQPPSFFYRERTESPHGFFEQFILNTTFAFRAPPRV